MFACFPEAASPERAAKQAGITIDDDGFLDWISAQTGDPILVEGVGGWAVPLTPALTVEDLAIRLGHPVVVVAANRLGMLNHTLLTVEAVRESGLKLAGVVVNNALGEPSELQEWNVDDLKRWLGPDTAIAIIESIDNDQHTAIGEHLLQAFGL